MLDVVAEAARKAGGVVNLAREMGVNHQTFYSWDRVPAERVLVIERYSQVSRHVIRPDIFGPVPNAACSQAAGDSSARAGETSPDPIPEISQSPAASRAVGDLAATPLPSGG